MYLFKSMAFYHVSTVQEVERSWDCYRSDKQTKRMLLVDWTHAKCVRYLKAGGRFNPGPRETHGLVRDILVKAVWMNLYATGTWCLRNFSPMSDKHKPKGLRLFEWTYSKRERVSPTLNEHIPKAHTVFRPWDIAQHCAYALRINSDKLMQAFG